MKKGVFKAAAVGLCLALGTLGMAACAGTESGNGGESTHTHSYAETWSYDEERHWHECTAEGECDAKEKDKAAHVDADGNGKCDECSYDMSGTSQTVAVTGVTLDNTEFKLTVGDEAILKATVAPADATDKSVTWSSSAPDIASVDGGKVTAKAKGSATITVTAANGKTAKCAVTVSEAAPRGEVTEEEWIAALDETEFTNVTTVTDTVTPQGSGKVTLKITEDALYIKESDTVDTYLTEEDGKYYQYSFNKSISEKRRREEIAAAEYTQRRAQYIFTAMIVSFAADKFDDFEYDADKGAYCAENFVFDDAIGTAKSVELKFENGALVYGYIEVEDMDITSATVYSDYGTTSVTPPSDYVEIVDVESIELNKTELELKAGSSETLTAIVLPENATDKTVTWNSSDPSVATVDNDGKVTAVAEGGATIIARSTANGKLTEATCVITVLPAYTQGLEYAGNASGGLAVTGIGTATDKDIVIPSEVDGTPVTAIGDGAFGQNTLTSISIPETVTSIGDRAFYQCAGLTEVTIPDSVESIGRYVFYQCDALRKVILGKNVWQIGQQAFGDCAVIEVYNRSSINNQLIIDKNTRSQYGNLGVYTRNIYSSEEGEQSKITTTADGYMFYKDDTDTYLIGYKGTDTELVLPDDFNGESYKIFMWAFLRRNDLTGVICSDGVTEIGARAFGQCGNLLSFTIGKNVTKFDVQTFDHCYKLVDVCNLSTKLTYDTARLKTIIATAINNDTLYTVLNVYTPEEGTSMLHKTADGFTFYDDGTSVYLMGYDGAEKDVVLPEKYDGKDYELYGRAFQYSSVTSVKMPLCATVVINYTFNNCTALERVIIPGNIVKIFAGAFYGCTALESVVIMESADLTYIADTSETSAFYGCDALTSVFFGGTAEEWAASKLSAHTKLQSVAHYYYSEQKPDADVGSYWHFGADGVTPVIWSDEG